MKIKPVQINLCIGNEDEKSIIHKEVTIGRHIFAKEYFLFERIWSEYSLTQLNAYVLSQSITKFGDLKTPISTSLLLKLDLIDFEDLKDGLDSFVNANKRPLPIDDKTVALANGIEIEGVKYDLVEFGGRTTGQTCASPKRFRQRTRL